MSNPQTRKGGCHCGKVRYEVEVDLSIPVIACNCSMCGRSGTWLTFVPADKFTLLSGEDSLSDYLFGKQHIHHLFCKTCGIKSFARGQGKNGPTVAVNARCFDDIELETLTLQHFDGKSI